MPLQPHISHFSIPLPWCENGYLAYDFNSYKTYWQAGTISHWNRSISKELKKISNKCWCAKSKHVSCYFFHLNVFILQKIWLPTSEQSFDFWLHLENYIVCFPGLKYKVDLLLRSVWSAKIVNSNISHSSSLVLCGFYLIQRFCNPNSRVDVVFKMWCISKLGTKRIMSLRKCVICCTIRNAQRIHKRT